ncbi:hypothetical protein [Legionella fallonii]|uniref:Uncharacterized protein n=1 Tax=Legionella fallonii LLAP-10 TaxID=1212491 RepID=A0A098G5V3_9GAMM|nr:hypothetical protein [Legionella fallonii]CEG56880.1 protein of unknown function [Coiled-coil] [Legionella fallonii LLAP-10]
MLLTEEENALMQQSFSITNSEHRKLLDSKLDLFERNLKQLRIQGYKIGIASIGAFLTRLFSLTSFLYPTDWACVAYVVHAIHQSGGINQQYRDDFANVKAMFDWCFPKGEQLSVNSSMASDPSIQRLVEQVGPLLSEARRSRLAPWINGLEDMGQSLVNSATSLVNNASSWVYNSIFGASKTTTAPQKNVMRPEVFAYLVRQLVTGKQTSPIDYYCYGEGSEIFDAMYQKAVQLYNKASNLTAHLKMN